MVTFRASSRRRSSSTYKTKNNKSQGVRLICRDRSIQRVKPETHKAAVKNNQKKRRGQSHSRLVGRKSQQYQAGRVPIFPQKKVLGYQKPGANPDSKMVVKITRKKNQARNQPFVNFRSFNEIVSNTSGNKNNKNSNLKGFLIKKKNKVGLKRGSLAVPYTGGVGDNKAMTLHTLPVIEYLEEQKEQEMMATEKEMEEIVYHNLPGILTVLDFYMLDKDSKRNERAIKKELYTAYKGLVRRCRVLGELERSVLIHSLILAKRAIIFGREKHEFKPGEFYLIYCACLFLSIKYVEDVEEWYLEDFASVAKIDKGCLHEMEIIVGINMLNFNVHSGKKEMEKVGEVAMSFEKKEIMKDTRFISEFFDC